MSQVSKTTQASNAEVLRDETRIHRNTKLRVYNLLIDLIDSSVFYDMVKSTTGTSETDTMSQKAITDAIAAVGPGGVGTIIAESYPNIAAMLADQADQEEGQWYRALDASDDPDVDSGWCIYEKLASSTGSLNDYYFILDEESLNITIQDASPTVKGIMKLFTVTGSGTDGTMDQNSITNALALKENLSNKVTDLTGNESSDTAYGSVKATLTWIKRWVEENFTWSRVIYVSEVKSTPVDGDVFGYLDSTDYFGSVRISYANFKAALKAVFDLVYVSLTGDQTISGVKTFNSVPVVGTKTAGTNTTEAASTAFVQTAISGFTADYGPPDF